MALVKKITRFRAYQLGNAGSSFSYYNGSQFTLIEARYNEKNIPSINAEMDACRVSEIDVLHITSWDQDHCVASQLTEIIDTLKPRKIEYPGYKPHTESGQNCLEIINNFKRRKNKSAIQITPEYINSLESAKTFGYNDILLHPKQITDESANDNSTVKLFRSGCFNVLSLGDVESSDISSYIRSCKSIQEEVDVLILAHHGANNGFTTPSFIKRVRPKIALASADYANQFKHPKQEIRDLLYKNDVKLSTTKTGDIVIYSTGSHVGAFTVENLMADSSKVSSSYNFTSKKVKNLNVNSDSIRARANRQNRGPGR